MLRISLDSSMMSRLAETAEHDGDLHAMIAACENELVRREGHKDGEAVASSWLPNDINTDALSRLVQGIEDGDPEHMDVLPHASQVYSGEWADSRKWEDKLPEILNRPYNDENTHYDDGELWESYMLAYDGAAQDAVLVEARNRLDEAHG